MNINRTKLKEFLDSKSGVELFLGNKIVKGSRNGKACFDISTDKEVFVKKESGEIFSVTDVSNFQNLHKPAIYVDSNNKPLNSESMVIPYTNLHLFTPMDERKYYVSVVSVYEDNLVKALGAVYDGGVSPSKCIKKSFGKR